MTGCEIRGCRQSAELKLEIVDDHREITAEVCRDCGGEMAAYHRRQGRKVSLTVLGL